MITPRKRFPLLDERPFVVVGVDCSPCSEFALRWALRYAHGTGAAVEAVHVWSDPWAIGGPPTMFGAGHGGVTKMHEDLARTVRAAMENEGIDDVPVVEEVLPGHAADVLVDEARDADLLVVGTRGLGRLERWLVGSVSRRCSEISSVPVVLVPDPAAHGREPAPEHHEHVVRDPDAVLQLPL